MAGKKSKKIECPLCLEMVDSGEMTTFDSKPMCDVCAEAQHEEKSMRDYWQSESNKYEEE